MKRWKRQRLVRQLALLAILLALAAAVADDAINGHGGLKSRQELEKRVEGLESDLSGLKKQRARLEHDAGLLGDRAQTEPALLEERARALLDLAHPSDVVIIDDAQALR